MFISIEGISSSGKTTQTEILADYFNRKACSYFILENSIDFRRLKFVASENEDKIDISDELADQIKSLQQMSDVIRANEEKYSFILADGYTETLISYALAYSGKDNLKNIKKTLDDGFFNIKKPDLYVILDVNPYIAKNRSPGKFEDVEIVSFNQKIDYNGIIMSKESRAYYNFICTAVDKGFKDIVIVNGSADRDAVCRSIISSLEVRMKKA